MEKNEIDLEAAEKEGELIQENNEEDQEEKEHTIEESNVEMNPPEDAL